MSTQQQKEHKRHTKTFPELTFNEQAKSITAMSNNLSDAIKAHVRKSIKENRDPNKILLKCIGQLSRSLDRLTK